MEKKIVMFIDDDSAFLDFVTKACQAIATIGPILSSCDGENAKTLLEDRRKAGELLPNLIFVDINMPRLDGFGFLKEFNAMKEKYPEFSQIKPIAMLTSSDQVRDREQAKRLGADQYIVKPTSLKETRAIISGLVR